MPKHNLCFDTTFRLVNIDFVGIETNIPAGKCFGDLRNADEDICETSNYSHWNTVEKPGAKDVTSCAVGHGDFLSEGCIERTFSEMVHH